MPINIRIEKVPIQLDRERSLVCNLYALAEVEAAYGDLNKAITLLGSRKEEVARKVLCLFLWHEDEQLTEAAAGELMQDVDEYYLLDRLFLAIRKSLPIAEKENINQSPGTESNGMEWDWFYYMGTVLLRMPEAVFWRCTLRKLLALWDIHERVGGLKKQTETPEEVFIDQLGW